MGTGASIDSFHETIERGNIDEVRRKLRKIPVDWLQRAGKNGETSIDVARRCGHSDIAQLLARQSTLPMTSDDKFANTFYTICDQVSKKEPKEWKFGKIKAVAWADAVDRGCAKNRNIHKTIEKIRQSLFPDIPWAQKREELIPIDGPHHGATIADERDQLTLAIRYLQEADIEDRPEFLLKAYSVESSFYWLLNRYICLGGTADAVKKFRKEWCGYFVGVILNHPQLKKYRYEGKYTYRGLSMTLSTFESYKVGMAVATKTFQSSSYKPSVTRDFTSEKGKIPVVIKFELVDSSAGLLIEDISDIRQEAEVLILPGTLFYVISTNTDGLPYQIYLKQQSLYGYNKPDVSPVLKKQRPQGPMAEIHRQEEELDDDDDGR